MPLRQPHASPQLARVLADQTTITSPLEEPRQRADLPVPRARSDPQLNRSGPPSLVERADIGQRRVPRRLKATVLSQESQPHQQVERVRPDRPGREMSSQLGEVRVDRAVVAAIAAENERRPVLDGLQLELARPGRDLRELDADARKRLTVEVHASKLAIPEEKVGSEPLRVHV
jgi:hypothetical protein